MERIVMSAENGLNKISLLMETETIIHTVKHALKNMVNTIQKVALLQLESGLMICELNGNKL